MKYCLFLGQTKHRSPEPTVKTERPDFVNTPLSLIIATRAASLKQVTSTVAVVSSNNGGNEISDSEPCKNGGCKVVILLFMFHERAEVYLVSTPLGIILTNHNDPSF